MIVLESVKAAIEDVTGTGEPPETEEGQFCLCRQAGGVQMVGCDDCGDWYHLKCINVTPTMAKTMHNYICPPCMAKSGRANQLSLKRDRSVHRTSRPNVMLLENFSAKRNASRRSSGRDDSESSHQYARRVALRSSQGFAQKEHQGVARERHQASREDCPSSRDERIRRALATRHRSSALGDTGESESAGIAHASSTGDVDGSGGDVCSDSATPSVCLRARLRSPRWSPGSSANFSNSPCNLPCVKRRFTWHPRARDRTFFTS